MTDDSEVPLDLQHAIADAERADRETTALELHPPEDWHDCPDCGKRLHSQSVIHEGEGGVLAVEYSCECLALWTWEQAADELHYRGESELVDDR